MTKTEAIDRTIELWTWLAETGKEDKEDWNGWGWNGGKYSNNINKCFLCDFAYDFDVDCPLCPYAKKFGRCDMTGKPFLKWCEVETPRTRKKYAKLFLAQVISLKEEL